MQDETPLPRRAGPPSPMTLRAVGLVKRYRHFALGPIDLELRTGRTYGLLGVNGAGKTTLLSCLAQQARLDGGAVAIDGERAVWADPAYRERVALVRELPVLYEGLSAEQHLRLGAGLFGAWNQALADRWIDIFRLDRHRRVRHCSKGMRVKLALTLALAHEPPFLLLDEPMNGVDIESRSELEHCLRTMAVEGRAAVVISSHVFQDVDALATDLLILREGRMALDSPYDVLGDLAAWTLPPEEQLGLPGSHRPLRTWTDRTGRHVLTRGPVPVPDADRRVAALVRRARLSDVYFAYARGRDAQ